MDAAGRGRPGRRRRPPVFSLALRGAGQDEGREAAGAPGGRAAAVAFSLAGPPSVPAAAPPPAEPAAPVMARNYRRLFIEAGIMAVYATARYWSAYHEWIEDWQYELTFEDQFRAVPDDRGPPLRFERLRRQLDHTSSAARSIISSPGPTT